MTQNQRNDSLYFDANYFFPEEKKTWIIGLVISIIMVYLMRYFTGPVFFWTVAPFLICLFLTRHFFYNRIEYAAYNNLPIYFDGCYYKITKD